MYVDKIKLKEMMNGPEGCRAEATALCHYATFEPDMEIVELLLKGADIQKAFNDVPLDWILQFCEPHMDTMITLLLKYKYYGLHLREKQAFQALIEIIKKVKPETKRFIIKSLKCHKFLPTAEQCRTLNDLSNQEVKELFEIAYGFQVS